MDRFKPTLHAAVLGAAALSIVCVGFVASASAEDLAKADGDQKPVTDVHGEGNNSSLRSNGVKDINAGNGGNTSNLRVQGLGTGGNPTGEAALSSGNCFADMPVYNKEGKFIGRGIVNTCN